MNKSSLYLQGTIVEKLEANMSNSAWQIHVFNKYWLLCYIMIITAQFNSHLLSIIHLALS